MKKISLSIIVIVLFLPALNIFPQTIEEINQQIELNRKKVAETPMKITYTIAREEIVYPKPIRETRRHEGGRVSTSQRPSPPKINPVTGLKEPPEMETLLITNEKAVMIICGECGRLEKFHAGEEEPYSIYSWNEKEARHLAEAKRTKDKKSLKMGYLFEDPTLLRIFRFYPLYGWRHKDFKDTDEMKILEDGTIQIQTSSEDKGTNLYRVSPSDNYMLISHDIIIPDYTLSFKKVIQTVNVGDLILPREIEIRRYIDEETIEQHFHYADIEFEILSEEKALSMSNLEFPEKTHVINMGKRPSPKESKTVKPPAKKDHAKDSSPPQP